MPSWHPYRRHSAACACGACGSSSSQPRISRAWRALFRPRHAISPRRGSPPKLGPGIEISRLYVTRRRSLGNHTDSPPLSRSFWEDCIGLYSFRASDLMRPCRCQKSTCGDTPWPSFLSLSDHRERGGRTCRMAGRRQRCGVSPKCSDRVRDGQPPQARRACSFDWGASLPLVSTGNSREREEP